jgi:hypothetical protein
MPAQSKRSQNQRLGFQFEIKENKTPGDEHYLDPPGAELLAWSKNQPSKLAILVTDFGHNKSGNIGNRF